MELPQVSSTRSSRCPSVIEQTRGKIIHTSLGRATTLLQSHRQAETPVGRTTFYDTIQQRNMKMRGITPLMITGRKTDVLGKSFDSQSQRS